MDAKIIEWLSQGPLWLRYAVEKQLLNQNPESAPVIADPAIAEIVSRLKNKKEGIPAIPNWMDADRYENPYWDLYFLADLGLTAADLNINKEIEDFLSRQAADGTYITEYGMQPTYFCKSVILLSAVTRLGFQVNPHIQKLVKLFLSSQRLDGGWYCNPNHNVGAPLQYEPSCPQENLNILLLLANYPEFLNDPRFNGAIDLLLKHWEMRDRGGQIVYFGVGKRYRSLHYPAPRYGIIRVLDAISNYPHALKQNTFYHMLNFVRQKGSNGRYAIETPTPYTSLEPQEQFNRLLTFIMTRIEKRVEDFAAQSGKK
jgi:hypothetical protein